MPAINYPALEFVSRDELMAHYAKLRAKLRPQPVWVVKAKEAPALVPSQAELQEPALDEPAKPVDVRRTISAILRATEDVFGIPKKWMLSHQRSWRVVHARQVAMALIRKKTGKSLPQIGVLFANRNHSTVVHAIEQIERKCNTDHAFAEKVALVDVRAREILGASPQ